MPEDTDLAQLRQTNRRLRIGIVGLSAIILMMMFYLVGTPLLAAFLESLRADPPRSYKLNGSVDPIDAGPLAATGTAVARSGNLSLAVHDPIVVHEQIEALAAELASEGAQVLSGEMRQEEDGAAPGVVMTVQVPADRFDEVVDRMAGMGLHVLGWEEMIEGLDEEYLAVRLRLESLRAVRQRLLEMIRQAETVEELLAVEEQLARCDREIQTLQGRLNALDRSSRFSVITVWLLPPSPSPSSNHMSVSQAGEMLGDGLRTVVDLVFLFVVVVLPWGLVTGLAAWGGWRLIHRREKKKGVEPQTDSTHPSR